MIRYPINGNVHEAAREYFSEYEPGDIPDWMFQVLKVNPNYCGWAPGDDSMWAETGWGTPSLIGEIPEGRSIKEMASLDDLNEIVNFYFYIDMQSGRYVLGLNLWRIYPRKGASAGIEIKSVKRHQLPDVLDFLREASLRNEERFSRIGLLARLAQEETMS